MAPFKLIDLDRLANATVLPHFIPVVAMSEVYPTACAALAALDCPPTLMRALLTALDNDPCAMVDAGTFLAEGGTLPPTGPWLQPGPHSALIAIVRMPSGRYFLGTGIGDIGTDSESHADEIAVALAQAIGRPVLVVRRTHLVMATPVVLQ